MRSTARPDSVAISDCAVVNFSCHFSVAVWCSVATACAAASRLLISQPIFPATTKQCPHPLPHGPLRPLSKQNCPNPPAEIRCPTHFLGAPTPVPLETVAALFAAAESMPLVHALAAALIPPPRGESPTSP